MKKTKILKFIKDEKFKRKYFIDDKEASEDVIRVKDLLKFINEQSDFMGII